MNELHLFAGAGGGILGGILLGHTCVCAVEIEPYCRRVLLQRQRDGILPKFPIWDDVRTFDGKPWRGKVDCVCGGFPCQDISTAGNGAGIDGDRSGLWEEMRRIIGEVRPRFALVENSPALTFRGLGRVLGDLADLGMDARWGVLGADAVGFPHHRARMWVVAYSAGFRLERAWLSKKADKGFRQSQASTSFGPLLGKVEWNKDADFFRGVGDGMADWMDRIHAIGNGQVPAVAASAFRILSGGIA